MYLILIVNILVLLFLLAMALWWGLTQNLLNAFVYLISTVIAATIAVAMWEYFVLGLLIWVIPTYAWGIGLLAPFVIGLALMRLIAFKYLRANAVEVFSPLKMGGSAACGLLSGILTSGVTVIGLGFLPLPIHADWNRTPQHQSFSLTVDQSVGELWIPVDRYAESFLAMLSTGAFNTQYPLARYQPHLATRAAMSHSDGHSDHPIVLPGSIKATAVHAAAIPRQGLDPELIKQLKMLKQTPGTKIVIVDTHWEKRTNTDTKKEELDIHPSQTRLSGHRLHINKTFTRLYAPVGYVRLDTQTYQRIFIPLQQRTRLAYQSKPDSLLAWVFVIPFEDEIGDLLIHQLRIELPKANTDPESLLLALGRLLYYNAPSNTPHD